MIYNVTNKHGYRTSALLSVWTIRVRQGRIQRNPDVANRDKATVHCGLTDMKMPRMVIGVDTRTETDGEISFSSAEYIITTGRQISRVIEVDLKQFAPRFAITPRAVTDICALEILRQYQPYNPTSKLPAYGVRGVPLDLISSCIRDRVQCVAIGDHHSSCKTIKRGLPHGSLLGPLLFMYIQTTQVYFCEVLLQTWPLKLHSWPVKNALTIYSNKTKPQFSEL